MTDFVWTDLENAVPGQPGSGSDAVVEPLNAMGHEVERLEEDKVDKETGKGLSTEDYTTAEKNKLEGIETGAQVNTVDSVAGKTGAVVLTKGDVGLSNVDNTRDSDKPVSTAQQAEFDRKQNALVSGENIKTINNESLLGSGNLNIGKWKLLGNATLNTTDTGITVSLPSGFWVNTNYTKFRLVITLIASDTYTNLSIPLRIYLRSAYGLAYRLFAKNTSSLNRPSATSTFYGQLEIVRNLNNIDVVSTILFSSPSQNGPYARNTDIYAYGNNGYYENNGTKDNINSIYLDAWNTSGLSFLEGSILSFYALEE